MTRREFGAAATAACAGGLLRAAPAPATRDPGAGTPSRRPNILWLTAEDMSPNLGCYGDRYARTPNLDRLAAESVRYTNAFATAPVCSPARSCLITGIYATSLGTQHLRSRFPVPAFARGFPSYLRAAGYFCSNNVKTDYNSSDEEAIIAASWDVCSAKAHWRQRPAGRPFFSVFNDMTTHQSRSMVWPHDEFEKEVQSRLAPAERHDPAAAPVPPYYPDTPVVRKTLARYHDCVSVMDKNVGALLKQLEDDGLAGDTIVFFFADNGAGLPRHKRLILDSGVHVPLLIRFPEKYRHLAPAAPGAAIDRLVGFVDFAPTMLSLAEIPIPPYMQGLPFLGPEAADTAEREHVFCARDRVDEAYDLARSVRDKRYLYIRNYRPDLSYHQPTSYPEQGEIQREITRLAAEGKLAPGPQLHYAGPTRPLEELYDVTNDPEQLRNLAGAGEHAATLERMRGLVRRWEDETRDLGFLTEAEVARRSQGSVPYLMARNPKDYPRERIRDAADLVGRGPSFLPRLIELLRDPDAGVRYWAVVAINALGEDGGRPAAGALEPLAADPAPSVRIEASAALCRLGGGGREPLAVLEKELGSGDFNVALPAARALELLGEKARPALPAMKRALAEALANEDDPHLFLRFALEPAVKKLGG